MCNDYPNCRHQGPRMGQASRYKQHCRTDKPNNECPYIALGCVGCTLRLVEDPTIDRLLGLFGMR